MSIDRLSNDALQKIISGKIKENVSCVIKFYSNDCHMCHALSGYYKDISDDEEMSDIHFFAFNINDNPGMEKKLNFNGVPTISVIKMSDTARLPKIRIMPDPDSPNEKTWYSSNAIKEFINKEIK
jgi:hypothetical protein